MLLANGQILPKYDLPCARWAVLVLQGIVRKRIAAIFLPMEDWTCINLYIYVQQNKLTSPRNVPLVNKQL